MGVNWNPYKKLCLQNLMSAENIMKFKLYPSEPIKGKTDWERLDSMTEEELHANALSDLDNLPLTEDGLARFKRVPNPKEIRERLKMTQKEFAMAFHLPLGTLRDWEQARYQPGQAAQTLLRVIQFNPRVVKQALSSS